jgi:hypothetical protein
MAAGKWWIGVTILERSVGYAPRSTGFSSISLLEKRNWFGREERGATRLLPEVVYPQAAAILLAISLAG